jgi:Carbohydrate esterase, sialic acid-specific acetylesterase
MKRTLLFLNLAVLITLPAQAAERPADVCILSGQSNIQGSGLMAELSEEDRTPCQNIFYWNGKAFEPLVPGQTKTSTRAGEFGPEITFARALSAKAARRDVYLIKHYVSGQPLHRGWDRDGFHDGTPAP